MTGIATEEFKMTELGPIPCDWEIGMLGSGRYFQILPSGIDNFTGQKKYLSTSSIQGWKIESPECLIYYGNRPSRANMQPRLNTVWFAKMIGSVKVYCFTESNREEVTEYILSTGFCGIRCKEDVDTEYLKFIFLSDYFNTLKDSLCSGTTQRAINNESISAIQVPLPPLLEQKKIAYVLSTVQTAIEKTDAVINAARELKKSLMKHLFTYGPVTIDETENVPLKETGIGFVPEEWEVINLGEYCNLATGKLNANQAVPGGLFPFFTCSQETYRIDRYSFDCEAVLLAGNNARGIYSVKYYSGKFDAYQRTYVITISDTSKLDYLYLKNALETKLEELRIGSIGTSTQFLTLKMLLNLRIPLPPLSLQIQMANLFLSVEHKAEAEENKKKALEALFRTLLSNLITGKIRVNNLEVPF